MIVAVGPQDNIVFVLICLDGLDSARANILEINGSGCLVGDPFICFCSGHFEDVVTSSVLLFWENGDLEQSLRMKGLSFDLFLLVFIARVIPSLSLSRSYCIQGPRMAINTSSRRYPSPIAEILHIRTS